MGCNCTPSRSAGCKTARGRRLFCAHWCRRRPPTVCILLGLTWSLKDGMANCCYFLAAPLMDFVVCESSGCLTNVRSPTLSPSPPPSPTQPSPTCKTCLGEFFENTSKNSNCKSCFKGNKNIDIFWCWNIRIDYRIGNTNENHVLLSKTFVCEGEGEGVRVWVFAAFALFPIWNLFPTTRPSQGLYSRNRWRVPTNQQNPYISF